MDNSCFKEYRCDCGKLLFKGILVAAIVEIKCKRCEKVSLFEENFSPKILTPFALKANERTMKKFDESSL